jgi:hypothetical protein
MTHYLLYQYEPGWPVWCIAWDCANDDELQLSLDRKKITHPDAKFVRVAASCVRKVLGKLPKSDWGEWPLPIPEE